MTATEELLERIDNMTEEEWKALMINPKLDQNIIKLLEEVGRLKKWLK